MTQKEMKEAIEELYSTRQTFLRLIEAAKPLVEEYNFNCHLGDYRARAWLIRADVAIKYLREELEKEQNT